MITVPHRIECGEEFKRPMLIDLLEPEFAQFLIHHS